MSNLTSIEVTELKRLIKNSTKKLLPVARKHGLDYNQFYEWVNGRHTGNSHNIGEKFEAVCKHEFGFVRGKHE